MNQSEHALAPPVLLRLPNVQTKLAAATTTKTNSLPPPPVSVSDGAPGIPDSVRAFAPQVSNSLASNSLAPSSLGLGIQGAINLPPPPHFPIPVADKPEKRLDTADKMAVDSNATTSTTKAPLTPQASVTSPRPLPVAWTERFGSRLALIVLLAAVGFATFVAMNGQDDQDKLGPLASDDQNLSLEESTAALTDLPSKKADESKSDTSITPNISSASPSTSTAKVAAKAGETARSEASLNSATDAPFALTPLENNGEGAGNSDNQSIPSLQDTESKPPFSVPKTPLPDRPPHNVPGKSGAEPVMAGDAKPNSTEKPSAEDELILSGPLASRQPKSNSATASVANLEAPQSQSASRPQYPNTGYPLPDTFLRYLQTAPPAMTAGYGAPNTTQNAGTQAAPAPGSGVSYPQTNAPTVAPPAMNVNPTVPNYGAPPAGANPGYAMPPGYAPSGPAYAPPTNAPGYQPGAVGPAGYAPPVTPAPTNPGTLPPAPKPF